jgi:hypothetical protein
MKTTFECLVDQLSLKDIDLGKGHRVAPPEVQDQINKILDVVPVRIFLKRIKWEDYAARSRLTGVSQQALMRIALETG